MVDVVPLMLAGCAFGLAGGFSPGPTTTVIVAQTLRYGISEGLKVAIAPALTDAPIIIVAVLLVGQLARFEAVLGVIALFGAAFLGYLAVDSLRIKPVEPGACDASPRSIAKGFMANLLNPHPYLFWFTIGAPKLLDGSKAGAMPVVAFLGGLYVCLIGAKMLVAVLVGKSRSFLQSRGYLWVNRLLGLVLLGYAVVFLRDALRYLNGTS